jgi:hypothetical protein
MPVVRPASAAVAVAVAIGVLAGACSDADRRSAGPADTGGLVLLTDNGEVPRLTAYDSAGSPHQLRNPDHPMAWISAGRRGDLVATLTDGSLRLSDRIEAGKAPTWKRSPSPDEQLPDQPLYFASWAPNGSRFVAMATDFGEAPTLQLFVVDPLADTTLTIPVEGQPVPAPPTWLDDARVAVQTLDGIVIVGIDSGDTTKGPATNGDQLLIDTAADGTRVAIGRGEPGRVEIRSRDDWLAGRGAAEATLESDGTVGAVALDRRGERLAVVWERADAETELVIYRLDSGWREGARLALPDDGQRGVPAWLP